MHILNFSTLLLAALVVVSALTKGKDPAEKTSVLLLDASTFPKVIPHHNLSTLVMIAPRADEGDYGLLSLKQDFWAFAEQAEFTAKSESVRFAQLLVDQPIPQGIAGEATTKLINRIDKEYLQSIQPRLYLFRPNSAVAEMYPRFSSVNVISLSRWLSQRTPFYMGTSGTIYEFYVLARKLMLEAMESTDSVQLRADILARTKSYVESLGKTAPEELMEMANYYLKTIERVIERGAGYVLPELNRLEDLVSGTDVKLSNEKKQSLQKRINVLYNFVFVKPESLKIDEL
jgi:hypothetical protein